jgi:serine protease Do
LPIDNRPLENPTITLPLLKSMSPAASARLHRLVLLVWFAATALGGGAAEPVPSSLVETIAHTQPKIVKIYGAGGLRGLEAYQSGFLISAEGHILTAWSTVLDTDSITVVLSDGRKFDARLLGADPQIELAVLRIDGRDLAHFDLNQAVEADAGTAVLAFSNLFNVAVGDEPASVQRGTIAVKTRLEARRGVFETPYTGPVYVLDVVTSNPGSAGGALVTRRGELVGMLGKELRNALNRTWLNYATPISSLRPSVEAICSGKSVVRKTEERKKPARWLTPAMLGLVLVPDVVERTPPYVDGVLPGSPAAKAGIRPDDLIVLVGDQLVPSCKALRKELEYIDDEDKVNVTVLRLQEMLEFTLQANRDGK